MNTATRNSNYWVDEDGFFGEFGGAYIPEMLHHNIETLQINYREIIAKPAFQKEFKDLLKNFVGRPTPLYHALNLSKKYGYPIFLKREDLCHTGAHKVNNTVGQILLAKELGKKKIVAETGAGQHGVATATVCALMGLECIIYMGEVDIARQQPNVARMKMMGAKVVAATSGSKTLKDATNEAMRHWINNPVDTHYIIGSAVGPHPYPDMVALFQSVISEECLWQWEEDYAKNYGPNPYAVMACVGGGSNAIGAFYHYINKPEVKLIAVEAAGEGVHTTKSAATTALGTMGVLHGSMTLLMQTSDGQVLEAHSISAGLDYPGIGPQHAHLFASYRAEYVSATDQEALEAALELSQIEGIIPALETAHALAYLGKLNNPTQAPVIVCLSGRGDKDLATYMQHLDTLKTA